MKKLIFIMLAGSLFAISSCTKSGPQGPAGNANVIGETPFTVGSGAWVLSNNVYSVTLTDGNITGDVAADGLVELFKLYPDNSWTNLPDINGDVSTAYNFYAGGFYISVFTTDGTTTPAPGAVTFRVVVVPSSVRKANPNTNWTNYNEAMTVLNASKSSAAAVSQ